MVNRSNTWPP